MVLLLSNVQFIQSEHSVSLSLHLASLCFSCLPTPLMLLQVQKDILAEVPQFYNEDTDARPKLALSDADVPGGKIWAQTTLLKERQELCEGITKEIRVVQGCHTLAK